MRMSMLKLPLAAACMAVGLVAQAYGGTVSAPYGAFNGSAGDPLAGDFIPSLSTNAVTDTWTVSGGVWQHTFAANATAGSGTLQSLQTTGVVGASFTQSTDMQFSAVNYPLSVGLAALANSATDRPANGNLGGGPWYRAGINMNGIDWGNYPNYLPDTLAITGSNNLPSYDSWDGPDTLASVNLTSNINTTDRYRLSVTGTYDGSGNLVLGATVTDLTTSTVIGSTSTGSISNPYTGQYFGYHEVASWGSGGAVDYSNYSLSLATVPEPMSMGLLGMASLGLIARRRRKA